MLHFHTLTKRLLLAAVALSPALLASAHDFEVDGIYYNITSDTTAEVTYRGDGDSYLSDSDRYTGAVVIPDEVFYDGNSYAVTSIGVVAFYGCSNLTSIEIPNSITYIGGSAFSKCISLTSVEIPNTVTLSGYYTFFGCSSLTSVKLPNTITSIGLSEFAGCSSLTSIEIPNSVTSIRQSAFSDCSSLTSVVIPSAVTSIEYPAFDGCSGLVKAAYPSTIVSIFDWNSELCRVEYPADGAIIEDGIVYGADKSAVYFVPLDITGTFEIPNSVTTIGYGAFYECSKLTSVVIPNSVTAIGYEAFYNCSSLTDVVIPNSVTDIGGDAFSGCSGLIKAAYPSTISDPFYYGIIHIEYPADGAIIEDGIVYGADKSDIYFVPLDITGTFEIPNSVTAIGRCAFYGCSGLTDVVIPSSVTTIGNSVFEGCSGLINVVIPSSVTTIGNSVFRECSGLTYVVIPNSVTTISSYAFSGCGLTSVEIPNSITTIGRCAFYGCSGLTDVVIPNSVTTIGSHAFEGCSSLMEMKVLSTTPPTAYSLVDNKIYRAATLYVPEGSVELYKTTEPWSYFENIVGIDESAIADVEVADADAPAEFYNLRGARVSGDALAPGVYIKLQGGCATKVLIQ